MINQKAYDNQMSKYEMIEQKVQNKVQQFYLCFEKWNFHTMERGKHKNQVNKIFWHYILGKWDFLIQST